MADNDNGESPLAKSTRAFQERAEQAGPAAGTGYTIIGAIIVCGGLGYAVDAWRGTSPWFLVAGLIFGVVVGMWELSKTVWPRR